MNGQGQDPSSDDADRSAPVRGQPSAILDTGPTNEPSVPDYELLRRIGRGAYGDVWLARSKATGVLRAAKIVWRHTFEDERPFKREFEGIQRFERISREHPSQLALFHIGRNEPAGYFYYVMELADAAEPRVESSVLSVESRASATDGPSTINYQLSTYRPHTLRADLERGRLSASRVLEIGLALSEALGHLHRNNLVHRDVKPSNVIFVNGRPKLADIGLVTDASDQCSIVGTEGYLPPEGPGTPQADIFALGKVLYEAATGLDRRQFPDLPPEIRSWPEVAQIFELNEIILKACSKDSDKRYSSAESMFAELQRLSGGKSIRRKRQVERGWRLVWRGAAGLTVVAAATALVVLAGRIRLPAIVAHIEKRSTNELANHYFDLGKTHFDIFRGTNFQIASDHFKKAIEADPNFAEAYGYLAATYFWEDDPWNPGWKFLPQAKTVALQALALDDSLAEPHLALGWYHAMREWNWTAAEKEDKRAVALNGSSPFCHLCYAELLRVIGRNNEALDQIYQAKSLDPHSRIINVRLIHYLVCARRFNDALAQIDEAVAMEAVRDMDLSGDRRDIFLALGQTDKAIESERDGRIADGESREKVEQDAADEKRAAPVEGAKVIWRPRLEWDKKQNNSYALYDQACCYAQLGEADEAFTCLDRLLKEHNTVLTFAIMTDWMLDPLRSDPRFHAILKTMHFE